MINTLRTSKGYYIVLSQYFLCRYHNNHWQTLLQQRHPQKYHSGNLWSNSCCSHPQPGEDILQAAHRRLKQELNTSADLKEIAHITYRAEFSNGLIEHEYDHILISVDSPSTMTFNPEEIAQVEWIAINQLKKQIIENPHCYTAWLFTNTT